MTFYKNKLSFLALGASVLSISACGYNHPNAMPSGYTYHHDTYKSPTPAASSEVTIEQRKYMDATQAEQFRSATYDLLERMTMRAGMPPKPVYIAAPDPMTTFYANIDNDLREGMRHIGYAISDVPEGAYVFAYEASPIPSIEGQVNANNVAMTLRVFSDLSENARQLTEESGQYFIQGADLLNITSSHYSFLPSPEKVKLQQAIVETPQYVAPVVAPAPVVQVPIVSQSQPTVSVDAVKQIEVIEEIETPAVKAVIPVPVVKEPIISLPAVVKPAAPKLSGKKPSRDDIIIINYDDKKPVANTSVQVQAPVIQKPMVQQIIEEPIDALEEIAPAPAPDKAVRSRVSLPVDY